MVPAFDAWDAWHPRELARRLAGVSTPWYVAAGWALDLFRGEQTRKHGDVEIAVPAGHFGAVAPRFPDVEFFAVGGGEMVPATPESLRDTHQTWALDPVARVWRFDAFREPHQGDEWICRRDSRIRRRYTELIEHTGDGIPYLAPEVALLFKAKAPREKDRADFAGTLPLLGRDRLHWLADALALVHPDHPWRAAVAELIRQRPATN